MSAPIHNSFTGETLNGDDLAGLKKALAEIDAYIEKLYGQHSALFLTRAKLRLRIFKIESNPAERSRV